MLVKSALHGGHAIRCIISTLTTTTASVRKKVLQQSREISRGRLHVGGAGNHAPSSIWRGPDGFPTRGARVWAHGTDLYGGRYAPPPSSPPLRPRRRGDVDRWQDVLRRRGSERRREERRRLPADRAAVRA